MAKPRKHHTPEFKLKAVMGVLTEEKMAAQLPGELEVHSMVLSD